MVKATTAPSTDAAISAALSRDWKRAIDVNASILKRDKKNIDALKRLGFALLMSGKLAEAKKTFQKVTRVDPYNQIALKNLRKLATVRQKDITRASTSQMSPMLFLEEPGKTKLVDCVHLAPLPVLSSLCPGNEVVLKTKNYTVELRSAGNAYLGALPDDLSFKLLKLIAAGNRYQVVVRSVKKNVLTVIIREVSRGKRFSHQPSFATGTNYLPYSREASRSDDTPDVTPTGEEDDQKEKEEV